MRVTVADNGLGIAPNMFPQIFRHQVTTKPGGHGIGLSVVQEFVEKSKGRLRVRSSTQGGCHGTVFSLFVPS
ncbi:MAG: ATP-binding protein [Acidobacteriaceae bacterium]